MNRRRFVFWLGFGMFGIAEKLHADMLDELAAAIMRRTEPATPITPPAMPEHWTAASNRTWQWFERENLIDGRVEAYRRHNPDQQSDGRALHGSERISRPWPCARRAAIGRLRR